MALQKKRTVACDPRLASRVASSFRDPSGFVFKDQGVLYRQVNRCYEEAFRVLDESGLYNSLVSEGLLIPHVQVPVENGMDDQAVAVLRPEPISFISYPYEWCFSQLRDAALLTLDIQLRSLDHGMSLKDASAYNVQFHEGRPVFIDTLSFDIYREGRPWVGYRQFCEHFLAPLALMSFVDPLASRMMSVYIDGIPLTMASKMLPGRTRANLGLLIHLHLHAKTQSRVAKTVASAPQSGMSKTALKGLIDNLRSTVAGLRYSPTGTVWADYIDETNYTSEAQKHKEQLVSEFIDGINPKPEVVWDLGANTGVYSRIASSKEIRTIAWDKDPAAVEKSYLATRAAPDPFLLPLIQDLTNPSPSLGWAGCERDSLAGRGRADAVMALALVHHLAIGNNVPFGDIAAYFSSLGEWLVVEFVPKEDTQVQRLLHSRDLDYLCYDQDTFEQDFSERFDLVRKEPIRETSRVLYLYRGRRT